jgi:moderate conductance mechanosensitive channel
LSSEEDKAVVLARRNSIIARTYLIFRLVVAGILLTWIVSLWGYNIPYAGHAVKTLFETLLTLALALFCWRFASAYIEKKIREAVPEEEACSKEEGDDEFGGAKQRGRSHTLLPMLRKFIGTVLVVMVALLVISSLGVNIGPLLAGAGVVGLAVGFGAQKLVCDVISGFFFLLDDAFRVGEYIQTGSIRGTVEAITLRNVMLRHHLGMLQIVPHSDLGAVTNYMRGGIVMKFPLEFSYDTDINKVRKIIKQVGIQMLEDPDLKDGFIQPIKSQGVNEITNSVMVIRVKFTAKPGKQFIIKREAFRRITEALSARGIHYAHRKVIVDFPEDERRGKTDPEAEKRVLEGAAAALISEKSIEQAAEKPADKIDDYHS